MLTKFGALLLGVIFLNLFAFITIRLRARIFKVKVYKPMLLNFKLSILPPLILLANIVVFMILSIMGAYMEISFLSVLAFVLFFAGLAVWLLFLPNSGYLITELNLNHRSVDDKEVPMWYDIVSVLSFALSGIVNALLSIVIIQTSFLVAFDPVSLSTADYVTLFLSGFAIILIMVIGIYLGRAVRFNSWDILHPFLFVKKLRQHFSVPDVWKDLALYITLNTLFFVIMYVAFGIPFYFI